MNNIDEIKLLQSEIFNLETEQSVIQKRLDRKRQRLMMLGVDK